MSKMTAYKGFERDLTCRGFQYEEGKEFEIDGDVSLCHKGFHACEDPLDCFGYYEPSDSVYHKVELDGVSDERSKDDTKVVAKKIRIGARLKLHELIKAAIDFRFSKTTLEPGCATDKERGAVSATGDNGAASATGYKGAASATGDNGAASATGDNGAALTIGNLGVASVASKLALAVAIGHRAAAAGCLDSWIVLAEREEVWNEEKGQYDYPIKDVKAFHVDGKTIKADTFYRLENGQPVEIDDPRDSD